MSERHSRSGKERRQIRAALHHEAAAIQVGKNGLDPQVLQAVEQALTAREAIKVKVGRNCPVEPGEAAETLARALGAEVVAVTGRTVQLFRPEPEE